MGEKISKKGRVTYSTVDARAEELKNPIEEFFIITNIETIRSDKIVEAFAKSKNRFGMVAIDEVHKCSNKSSQQGSNVLKLQADFKVAATGTLITNNPINSYLPLSWTDNDQATLTNYKSQYCKFGGFSGYEIVGYQNLDLLREEVESCSVRRTLDQVKSDMPPKSVTVEYLEMDPAHEKFYEAIKEGVKEEADKVELHPGNLLALTTRLRQATACPSILTSNAVESTKINRCIEIVEELVGQGEKVVVMSNFKEPIYQLAKALDRYKPLINTGDIADDQIARNVKAFQEDPSVKIFLGTHARVGTGLTLNAAMYLICIDTPFTYASFSQSCDRIYRINNTRPAIITTLVCKNTIDERVAEILERKRELGDYLVDGKMSDGLADEMRRIILEL